MKMFETFGDVTIGEIQFNSETKEFFTSARLSTEEKAKSLIAFFKQNKQSYPFVSTIVGGKKKKELLKDFKTQQKDNLYCTICPIKADIPLDQIKTQVQAQFPNFKNCHLSLKNGVTSITFIFANTNELYHFI